MFHQIDSLLTFKFILLFDEFQVTAPEEEDNVDNLLSIATGEGNVVDSLLSSGRNQKAKQIIVALASLINTSPSEV